MNIQDLDTPAVVIDETIVDRNIKHAQTLFNELGIALRPHVKTHKLPILAQRQMDAGAVGITCQKVSEAEVFAESGFSDILISYNILGKAKLRRLKALAEKIKVTVVADNEAVVDGLAGFFQDPGAPLGVLIEIETGLNRCGVASPVAARDLARRIDGYGGLRVAGLLTYPPAGNPASVQDVLSRSKEICENAIGPLEIISSGGTPSMNQAKLTPVVTEFRPGAYIYNDRSLISRSVCGIKDCALTVLTQVISRPNNDRAVVDAGAKTLTTDLMGATGYGMVREYPQAMIATLSEEHGHLDISRCARKPEVGDLLSIIPNHASPVSNLCDTVHLHRDGKVTHSVPVAARGCVY